MLAHDNSGGLANPLSGRANWAVVDTAPFEALEE
jgi:hypothetical protein